MHTLPISLSSLLGKGSLESERIEYKASWNPEAVLHSICAFANDFHNLGGGYIVIGLEEQNGRPLLPPKGLQPEQIDAIQKELLYLERTAILPSYNSLTATYEIEGKLILVIWAMGGEVRPYKAKKSLSKDKNDWAYYIRKHTSTVQATGSDEQELISLANTVPFDDRYRTQASLEDLEPHLMREFLQAVKSDLAKEARDLSVEELGLRMNIVGGVPEARFPKNVGLMFFNSQPDRFFPYTQIDVVHFPQGTGANTFEEKTFKGPLAQIISSALNYIYDRYLVETVIKHPDRPEAERFFNYPLVAIEEALVNAVYHRSYEIREPIEVRIHQDELIVLSYPGPDRSIKLSDLQKGRAVSRRYRNRRIGEFLKELDLTEGRSTGIPKILEAMRNNGSPDPIFESDEDRSYFMIRLPIHSKAMQISTPTPQDAPVTIQENIQENIQESDLHKQLIQVLDQPYSTKELMEKLGLQNRPHFAKHYLKPSLQAGVVEMTIPDKPNSRNQKYRLTAKGKQRLQALQRGKE
ncbi:transcriptional regulator [Pasteurellaceae bacterium RH1A]|nr:transcriptional regulator [Pasteurellaceae bacterium RH1A]